MGTKNKNSLFGGRIVREDPRHLHEEENRGQPEKRRRLPFTNILSEIGGRRSNAWRRRSSRHGGEFHGLGRARKTEKKKKKEFPVRGSASEPCWHYRKRFLVDRYSSHGQFKTSLGKLASGVGGTVPSVRSIRSPPALRTKTGTEKPVGVMSSSLSEGKNPVRGKSVVTRFARGDRHLLGDFAPNHLKSEAATVEPDPGSLSQTDGPKSGR